MGCIHADGGSPNNDCWQCDESVRLLNTATPKELLDEAKSWRAVAPFMAGDFLAVKSPACQRAWNAIPSRVYENMRDRLDAHLGAPTLHESRLSYYEQCLFCLFLALECEDEANALKGGR